MSKWERTNDAKPNEPTKKHTLNMSSIDRSNMVTIIRDIEFSSFEFLWDKVKIESHFQGRTCNRHKTEFSLCRSCIQFFVVWTFNSVVPSAIHYNSFYQGNKNIHVVNDKLFHTSVLDVDVVVMALVILSLLLLLLRLVLLQWLLLDDYSL